MICGERFPVEHLLFPTASEELAACPACVFDGDLTVYYADPPWLAYQLDGLLDTDLAAPATWAAVAAVLATGAAPDVVERLQRAWRAAGTITLPDLRWGEPDAGWLWLPRPEQRPPWQAQLGPCARPGALVTALEAAHPGLREAFVEELHADFLDQIDDDPDEPRYPAPDADTLARGWRAAVSYATALHTDTTDHPGRGDPWHALESFDSLHEHLLGLGGESDDILLTAMVHAGITAMSEHGAIPAR